jgi:tetratricopeptide (TPR) repeat protein
MKTSKIAILTILVTVIVMAAPASAYVMSQNIETKAERMVEIADGARDTVMDLVALVEANATAKQLILDADLDEDFYGNVSLCVKDGTIVNGTAVTGDGEGWTYLDAANISLLAGDYEDAIDNAREALAIFRDVLRSINDILYDAGVETDQILDAQILQEAIERSLDRIEQLRALLADEELLGNLTDAEDLLLNEAQALLNSGEIEDAKDALIAANSIISDVCQQLKEIAQELNPSRIERYLGNAHKYKEKFKERFGHAWDEEIDVDEFLKALGYQNEEDFMAKFQDMIENAQGAEDIKEAIQSLKEIGQTIRNMDSALTQEFGRHRGGQGQSMPGNGNGYGNMGGGNSP